MKTLPRGFVYVEILATYQKLFSPFLIIKTLHLAHFSVDSF